ncbi:hypothetical protein BDY19DRAFT_982307 [Irpex rosettiformis]|uniref:Uncharacterized protein n=1 Tax=Irpex rosettiformis TaxID=378272 RepID=A0ACB8UKV1_9APHY|nr:hypothetical protein BDY19DRAFT_982307 [Irpex rosettiformis]
MAQAQDALSSRQSPPPSASATSTFSRPRSTHSSHFRPSNIKTVVTAPPWARDEPPSPGEELPPPLPISHEQATLTSLDRPSDARPSDVTSNISSGGETMEGPSRWWTFTRPRPEDPARQPLTSSAARLGFNRGRTLSVNWLPASLSRRPGENSAFPRDREILEEEESTSPNRLHLDLPLPTHSPQTLAQAKTPGWDVPWSPRVPGRPTASWDTTDVSDLGSDDKTSRWQLRKKRVRIYMLTNVYVPLLFRVVNIMFTTSALVIAIRIRRLEMIYGIEGILGASPTLVIIFAPLTLVHVIVAIYLEYFGRPLGLWRTSGKLAHTLVEVVFICAWSAALGLSFDNFFTSIIPCAASSTISWYSSIPRPDTDIPDLNSSTGVGETLCDEQIALICLVGVGLIMYCFNLVISLYRIFEKVKYHPTTRS